MKFLKTSAFFIFCAVFSGCSTEPPEGMVLVSSGYFNMGTDLVDTNGHALSMGLDKPWFADESPERRINLKAFYIDKFEVTNKNYYIFCQATDCKSPRHWGGMKYPDGQDDLPVTGVSFFDAADYAHWSGKRLPTEMEWEKAARGENGLVYPWGDVFDVDKANVSPSIRAKTGRGIKPVGSFSSGASPYGAHDMVGNVWEWVWDYYLPYPDSTYKTELFKKKYVVVRGLSYLGVGHFPKKEYMKVVALKSRASFREKLNPLARKIDVGFRCAKSKPSLWEQMFPPEVKKDEKVTGVL
ncbi:MAG: formylglycine-generating enzyme family protein [Nitrospinales bacterium]